MSEHSTKLSKPMTITSWVLQIVAAAIVGQTTFFKFTGAPETVALFDVVGGGNAMMYGTSVIELVAVVLLLVPRSAAIGGIAIAGVMSGAMMAHFTKLGISINPVELGNEDLANLAGPSLFVMGVIAWTSGLAVAAIRRRQIPIIGPKLFGKAPAEHAEA